MKGGKPITNFAKGLIKKGKKKHKEQTSFAQQYAGSLFFGKFFHFWTNNQVLIYDLLRIGLSTKALDWFKKIIEQWARNLKKMKEEHVWFEQQFHKWVFFAITQV